jgi:hypothetical protein
MGEPTAAYRGLQFLLGLQPPTARAKLPTGELHFPDGMQRGGWFA